MRLATSRKNPSFLFADSNLKDLRKGVSLGYVGRNENLKDLKDLKRDYLAFKITPQLPR